MWMMGYNDGGEFNMPADSFNGRKFRPLIPRTIPSANNTSTSNASCLGRIHGNDFFSLNHHLASMADQGKREFNTQPIVVSSRWNPTPEQLRTLEELYRRGTRTPSAEQIQHITAHLRSYGKIEGKNVFYWFQNHKARERQKRRRQMESTPDEQQHRDIELFERKESGTNRTGYEGEQTKNWAPSTNCSTLSEESGSTHRAAKSAVAAECRPDGWIQFDEGELQHRRCFMERNATWQMIQSSCPSPTHLINTSTSIPTSAAAAITMAQPTSTTLGATVRTMGPNLFKTRDINIFIAPGRENGHAYFNNSVINEEESGCEGSQTLQLFPLRSGGGSGDGGENVNDKEATAMNCNFTPHRFFEFLPLKN